MIITSVEKSKKNKDRMLIYIDGQYSFSILEEDYISMNLYEAKELSGDDIEYIRNNINFRAAKATAVKYLSMKLRSRNEIALKLEGEGYDNDIIENVIEELKSMGYINDRIYVQKYVYDRSKLKPKSKKLLRLELQNKGIESEIIDEIFNDWEMDETTIAESLARKKFGKYDLNDEKVLKKIYAFLHHRGFGFGLIEEVIGRMKDNI